MERLFGKIIKILIIYWFQNGFMEILTSMVWFSLSHCRPFRWHVFPKSRDQLKCQPRQIAAMTVVSRTFVQRFLLCRSSRGQSKVQLHYTHHFHHERSYQMLQLRFVETRTISTHLQAHPLYSLLPFLRISTELYWNSVIMWSLQDVRCLCHCRRLRHFSFAIRCYYYWRYHH